MTTQAAAGTRPAASVNRLPKGSELADTRIIQGPTLASSRVVLSAISSSGAAHASVPKCVDTYSASISAAAPTSATLATPSAVSSTLLDLRSLRGRRLNDQHQGGQRIRFYTNTNSHGTTSLRLAR